MNVLEGEGEIACLARPVGQKWIVLVVIVSGHLLTQGTRNREPANVLPHRLVLRQRIAQPDFTATGGSARGLFHAPRTQIVPPAKSVLMEPVRVAEQPPDVPKERGLPMPRTLRLAPAVSGTLRSQGSALRDTRSLRHIVPRKIGGRQTFPTRRVRLELANVLRP